jgi:hypothetical protein
MCGIIWCSTLGEKEADAATKPMRSAGKSAFEHVGAMPFPMLQSLFDGLYPPGLQWYWRADFVKELSDKAIAEHLTQAKKLPTPHSTMHLYPIDGAAHKVANDATAFSYRDANWAEVIVGVDPDPANAGKITQWTKDYFDALHPYSAGGAYVNFMMDEGQERIRASFRGNYDRLAQIKRKYDPKNFFRVNQNIQQKNEQEQAKNDLHPQITQISQIRGNVKSISLSLLGMTANGCALSSRGKHGAPHDRSAPGARAAKSLHRHEVACNKHDGEPVNEAVRARIVDGARHRLGDAVPVDGYRDTLHSSGGRRQVDPHVG